jgi:hypothetical protein
MSSENQEIINLLITMDKRCMKAQDNVAATLAVHKQLGCCPANARPTRGHEESMDEVLTSAYHMSKKLDAFRQMVLEWFKPDQKLMEAPL